MLCASNMSALIPPGCAAMQRGGRLHSGTTPRNGALAAIFLIPEFETTDAHGLRKDSKSIYSPSTNWNSVRTQNKIWIRFYTLFVLSVFYPCPSV
jgi:hypothetical protein